METLKDVQDNTQIVKPHTNSWVASRFNLVQENGVSKRRCNSPNCGKEYSRGTSHMILKRHWSKQHAEQFNDSRSSNKANRANSACKKSSPNKKRGQNELSLSANVIKNKSSSYQQNISSTNTPSSNDKTQLDVKLVARRLKEAVSIHLTFDIYTAKKGAKSYGIITAHSLSDTLEIKSVLLEYRHLPYPDDSTTLYEFLRSCIIKFNIREKIVSLASNCSNTIASAVQEMDKKFRLSRNFHFTAVHIKCFPQFIHLNVIEVLRSQDTLLDSVRKVVGFINNNNFTLRPLQQSNPDGTAETVVENNTNSLDGNNTSGTVEAGTKATGLKLPYDNRSSWNTTYSMIEIFFEQRGFIEPTLLYFQNPQELANINIDWDRMYTLIQLLKPFHDVVNKFAADNYAPVSLVAVSIPHLMDHLTNTSWGYDDLIMAAENFKSELESYRQLFQSDLTVLAGLLDPRVKDAFISTEGRDNAIDILRKRLTQPPQVKNDNQIHQYSANSIWTSVFRECNYDEISDYLEHPREHGYSCNIAYWEAHKNVYPCLYVLAKILVCVQATSVPSDRMFSAGENADRERKIQIDSTNSKELMKSWAKYLEK